ncbi:hypothetical protein [Sphingomonas aerophila]|uniref:Uncharacterized protein n=1 Tax=Sphingomonas aerophila TaxID=1344948 RepID=A0A7W9EWL4_9SPHN|nr:hypothetical protein [Sphingomonas aerophila]MBB5715837.1 hypothetical protein [Sphingomonas aerophila]
MIPSDMWQMLIRIETATARSETKIDGLSEKLGVIGRVDDHERKLEEIAAKMAQRELMVVEYQGVKADVAELKAWRSTQDGTVQGLGLGWKLLAAAFAFLGGAGTLFGVQSLAHPKQVLESKATVERSISVPAQSGPR